jgi:hypothetical protein
MTIPGFTAATAFEIPHGRYASGTRAPGFGTSANTARLATDSVCGECNCTVGQCCDSGGGNACSCYRCGSHVVSTVPAYLNA